MAFQELIYILKQGLEHFFRKRPDSKYFRLLVAVYSLLQLANSAAIGQINHTQYINQWVRLHSNKTLLTKMGSGPGPQYANPCNRTYLRP